MTEPQLDHNPNEMTEQEMKEKEFQEAKEYVMAELARQQQQNLMPALPAAVRDEEKKEEKEEQKVQENTIKRGYNKAKEKVKEFKDKYPGLIKAAGKSAALVVGLQVTRWIFQTFL